MANKELRSITFPDLPDIYHIPQQAETFSASSAYAVGDYCIYEGTLYRFTAAHSAGAWDSTHVTAASVAEDLAQLKSDLKAATEATADLHLGFYLDANGDLCQVDN